MLTFRQGCTIAKEVDMHYEPGWNYAIGEEDTTMHVFRTGKMDSRSCWIDHTFYFADSVQECLEQKQEPEERPHPDACTCDQCAADRFAFCGYED